jgi:6-pyruvoyltetrahydropterin/6-carboxytetrahydropterin synthase
VHGHSYIIEVLIESNFLDNGQMVYDFGLTKLNIKDLIDAFDHAISIWDKDDMNYIKEQQRFSDRWVLLPVSPSAEQLSRVLFLMIDKLLQNTSMINGEKEVSLNSIIVHETATGYAKCFRDDAYSVLMGKIDLEKIIFSNGIKEEWVDKKLWEHLLNNGSFLNPKSL